VERNKLRDGKFIYLSAHTTMLICKAANKQACKASKLYSSFRCSCRTLERAEATSFQKGK